MLSKLIVASDTKVWEDQNIDTSFLKRNKFYKVLSLVEASRAEIQILPTLLLLSMNQKILSYVIRLWELPLMIRMDYKSLPKKKTLGGVSIYKYSSIKNVASFLFREHCYPVFHPGTDRFNNIYSVGIMIEPNNPEIQIEVLGKGFDASDLRLGHTIPHEYIKIDLLTFSTLRRWVISRPGYSRERNRRIDKAKKLLKYTEYVNQEGRLLSSLDLFDKDIDNNIEDHMFIPDSYTPLSKNCVDHLSETAQILYSKVVRHLPHSESFVASFSYLANKEWILWDVYGQWYRR